MKLADGLELRGNPASQVYAFLGRRGAGKTYAAGVLVERLLDAGAQVIIIDPIGVWWGLRLAADGMGPGIPIPIIGGAKGDVPIHKDAGAILGEAAASGMSMVIDVSEMVDTEQVRLVAAFSRALFNGKKQHKGPVLVVFEEADSFIPQNVEKGMAAVVHSIKQLAMRGRNFGIGVALLSLRPQAVNKHALNMAEFLAAGQMTGPQERATITKWVQETGAPAREKVAGMLPALKPGNFLVWSPSWLQTFGEYRFDTKRTYDSSATPDGDEAAVLPWALPAAEAHAIEPLAGMISAADPGEIAGRGRAAAKASRDVETKLRARVEELERETAKLRAVRATPAFDARGAVAKVRAILTQLGAVQTAVEQVGATLDEAQAQPPKGDPSRFARTIEVPKQEARPPKRTQARGGTPLPKGEGVVLTAVAQHVNGVTRDQLSVLTGYKRSSRDNYLQRLQAKGLVQFEGAIIHATTEGEAALGDTFEPLPSGAALREYWLGRLPKGEGVVLGVIVDAWPGEVTRPDIDYRTGYKRSSRDNYLQRLASRKLIEVRGGAVRASDTLFDG